jgi:DNA-binding transcriptional MocR family regulator
METIKESAKDLLYLRIAGNIEHQIKTGVLCVGDKLPSLRTICREYGVSQSTALQAYYQLESKTLIESRPQSGYFVRQSLRKQPAIPQTSNPETTPVNDAVEQLIGKVYHSMGAKTKTLLSLGVPSNELLPIAKLNKGLVQAMRDLEGSGTGYEQVQGNEKLRRQIARWSLAMESNLSDDDIITTAGCMNALSYCLMALTERGDTIAVESPVYFGILQLAKSLGLNVLELPTHPQTGIELDALKKAFASGKVKLCMLISNFSNPLGSCMPDEHKKEVVRLLEHYNIPLIEDDLYGDVYFGTHRPKCCKTYDESGMVLWCGSVSKTLAPGYRVGWVAPGKFKDKVLRLKLYHSISSNTITQEVIANFLETGRYENYLRKLRHTLYTNYLQYSRAVCDYFPEGTKASRPQGGFVLWIELARKADTIQLYEKAMKQGISIAPGRMFTLQQQFNNCMRISYGLRWNEQLDEALRVLGKLSHEVI